MLLPERDIFKGCAKETVRQLRGCRHNKGDGIGQGLCGLAAVVFQKHDELMLTRQYCLFPGCSGRDGPCWDEVLGTYLRDVADKKPFSSRLAG